MKSGNQECELKTYEDNKLRSQKSKIAQKIDEESLQLYGFIKKATEN